jgi:asparagine N-glycosylation enzyme membrane subunit Stt3
MRVIEPPQPSEFFTRVDRGDKSAVILLLASLTAAFLGVRAGAYELLGGETDAFKCAQSIIINVGAALLFLKAYHLRRTEIRNVAVLVTVIGALKVFVIDLFGARGIPLVMSVLSLGVAAALGSVILGKWHRLEEKHGIQNSEG